MKKSNVKGMIRGASMTEYAMLLFAVLIISAAAVKTIGPKVSEAGTKAATELGGAAGGGGAGGSP